LNQAKPTNAKFEIGITMLMKEVRQIVVPTAVYQSMLKSSKPPVRIGKFEGKVTTDVQSALIKVKISPVAMNWTTHILVVVDLSFTVASWWPSN